MFKVIAIRLQSCRAFAEGVEVRRDHPDDILEGADCARLDGGAGGEVGLGDAGDDESARVGDAPRGKTRFVAR